MIAIVRSKRSSRILLLKYRDNVVSMNKETANTYKSELYSFEDFADNILENPWIKLMLVSVLTECNNKYNIVTNPKKTVFF